MGMKLTKYLIALIVIIGTFEGCSQPRDKYSKRIIGKWNARTDWANLTISFSKDTFFYHDAFNKERFKCLYKIQRDTLFLFKTVNTIDKHFIDRLDNENLILNTLSGEIKAVPILDGLIFNR